jgi:hypothetical protein
MSIIKGYSLLPCFLSQFSLSLRTHPKLSTVEGQSRIKNFIPRRWYGMSTTSHIDRVTTHAKTMNRHLMVTESTNFPVFSNDHKQQVSNTYLISKCQEERTITHAWVPGFFIFQFCDIKCWQTFQTQQINDLLALND